MKAPAARKAGAHSTWRRRGATRCFHGKAEAPDAQIKAQFAELYR
jgi:hypothetical protein